MTESRRSMCHSLEDWIRAHGGAITEDDHDAQGELVDGWVTPQLDELRCQLAAAEIKLAGARLALAAVRDVREAAIRAIESTADQPGGVCTIAHPLECHRP